MQGFPYWTISMFGRKFLPAINSPVYAPPFMNWMTYTRSPWPMARSANPMLADVFPFPSPVYTCTRPRFSFAIRHLFLFFYDKTLFVPCQKQVACPQFKHNAHPSAILIAVPQSGHCSSFFLFSSLAASTFL